MSKSNVFDSITETIKVPADITKAVLEPPANQLGQSLADIFYLVFSPITKKRAKVEQNIELYKSEIANEVSKIDPEKLIEPKLSIVGPALEASKYYIEEDSIRSMFTKLIAASVNSDYANSTFPAFVEIVKQLSPFDAKNLAFLYDRSLNDSHLPAGRVRLKFNTPGETGITIVENFIPFVDLDKDNEKYYSASIDNLIRLGLIKMLHGYRYDYVQVYEILDQHKLFLQFKEELEEFKKTNPNFLKRTLIIERGSWGMTTFGKLFSECCL